MLAQWIKRNANTLPPNWLRHVGNLWSPFRGAGIKIAYISPDYREVHVTMKLRWFNRNYVGTHFGGSLYAMTDPFYMMMLINNLGNDYIVWDKGARIDFVKPGRGTVHARFLFTEEEIQAVKAEADQRDKYVFEKLAEVVDDRGALIARIDKVLYVRRKKRK